MPPDPSQTTPEERLMQAKPTSELVCIIAKQVADPAYWNVGLARAARAELDRRIPLPT